MEQNPSWDVNCHSFSQ